MACLGLSMCAWSVHVLLKITDSLQSLQALHKAMPEHLRENSSDPVNSPEEMMYAASEYLDRGRTFLADVYGKEQGSSIQKALYGLSPRLGHYSVPLVYGCIYADTSALTIRQVRRLSFDMYKLISVGLHLDVPLQHGCRYAKAGDWPYSVVALAREQQGRTTRYRSHG